MQVLGIVRESAIGGFRILALLLLFGCGEQTRTPMESPDARGRQLRAAFEGEMGVFIMVNGENLTSSVWADRLRVDVVIDAGRPTFAGNLINKTVQIAPDTTQASEVSPCIQGQFCELNVVFHDLFGGPIDPDSLDPWEGILADGDYTVKLYRDDCHQSRGHA